MSDPAEGIRLRWSGMTHPGRVRKNNEDAFLALQVDGREIRYLGRIGESSHAEQDFVFAVSDGMGGANAGEFASKIAVEKTARLFPKVFRLGAQKLGAGAADVLAELFDEIHRALVLLGSSYEECAGMGATLSLGWFTPGWMHFGHVGDSRIYYLPAEGEVRQLTHDHTHTGWLRRQGKINEREARTHPMRHSLNRTLGAGHRSVEPQIGSVSCDRGDRFLFCTDGVVDGLWDHSIIRLLRNPAPPLESLPPADRLVQEAVRESGKDNATAVVVEAS
jgi:serine/threonine protein phosphatase PrpC